MYHLCRGKTMYSHKILYRFGTDESGSVAVYSAFLCVMLLGASALVVDYGRGAVVKQQLQNYADSAAQAGAAYLDGTEEAITRATAVVNNTISKQSSIADGSPTLTVENINFYSSISPLTPATDGTDAQFLEVEVSSEEVTFLFTPLMSIFSGDSPEKVALDASAIASGNPVACAVPPLMLCDYSETMGSDYDVRSPSNYGKQVKLGKASGINQMAPGNFGVLDTPSGSQATQDIAVAMAALEPEGCYGSDGIDTAPGARVDAIRDGINARFDMPAPPHNFEDPAPNIIHYPRDTDMSSTVLGSGDWGFESYWSEKHPDADVPDDMPASPSRYQVYLYELGATFAYNGKVTVYPADAASVPDGYTLVEPQNPGIPSAASEEEDEDCGNGRSNGRGRGGSSDSADSTDPNYDGVPDNNTPVDDPTRRVVQAVLLNCQSDNVRGNGGPYPSHGKYVELFVTESVGQDHTIYAEVVRRITPSNSTKLHSNVGLNQ